MKRIFIITTMLIMMFSVGTAHAELYFDYEAVDIYSEYPLIYIDNPNYQKNYDKKIPPASYEVNGKTYIWSDKQTNTHALLYSDTAYNTLSRENYQGYREYDCDVIWTGEYYMVRNARYDKESSGYWQYIKSPIQFYDSEFNLVREQTFDGFPYKIEFYNNTYYCKYYGSGTQKSDAVAHIMASTDTVNWVDITDEEELMAEKVGNVLRKAGNYTRKASIDGDNFYDLSYEDGMGYVSASRFGEWICYMDFDNQQILFSKDGIYTVPVKSAKDLNLRNGESFSIEYIYEYGDELIVDTTKYRITIEKESLYTELEELNSPYVVYNDSILAFETPPVIENDTTLIPIRFLFEQMGAEVDWEQDTRTATISKDGTVITFTIDNTTAMVNGEPAEMTLPAQLINDKTMVPVRFLSEELGYTVTWDGDNRIITIE